MRLHYKVKDNGQYVSRVVYTILAVNCDGHKELLGLYLSENEGVNYWLPVLTDLHNRDLKDILIACMDGLKGFAEDIESIYPKTKFQRPVYGAGTVHRLEIGHELLVPSYFRVLRI